MEKLLLALAGKIIRHARRVHRELGPGRAKYIYRHALQESLRRSGAMVVNQPHFRVHIKGQVSVVSSDLLVRMPSGSGVIIECKVTGISQDDFDSLRLLLRAYRYEAIGLILSFGNQFEFRQVMIKRQRA